MSILHVCDEQSLFETTRSINNLKSEIPASTIRRSPEGRSSPTTGRAAQSASKCSSCQRLEASSPTDTPQPWQHTDRPPWCTFARDRTPSLRCSRCSCSAADRLPCARWPSLRPAIQSAFPPVSHCENCTIRWQVPGPGGAVSSPGCGPSDRTRQRHRCTPSRAGPARRGIPDTLSIAETKCISEVPVCVPAGERERDDGAWSGYRA